MEPLVVCVGDRWLEVITTDEESMRTTFTPEEVEAAFQLSQERGGGWIPTSLIRERAASLKPRVKLVMPKPVVTLTPPKPAVVIVMPPPKVKLVF